jgi:hypothetical protein
MRRIARQALIASLVFGAVLTMSDASPCRTASARAALPTIVATRFVLVDTAPVDQQYDVAADDRRIGLVSDRARALIARSGAYRLLDRGPEDTAPPYSYFSCPACIWDWAHSRGADYVLVSWVQKQSRLILSVGMLLLDARSETVVKQTSTQIRNDTDRMWLAATDYLLKRDILAAATHSKTS